MNRVDTLYVSDTNGLKLNGTLHGSINLVDYHLAPTYYVTNASGATVHVESTNFTTTTDSAGRWTINDLPAGIYTVTISKEGFGTYKIFGQQFVGGGELYIRDVPILGRILTGFSIENLRIDTITGTGINTYYSFGGETSPDFLPPYITPYLAAVKDTTASIDPTTMSPVGQIYIDPHTGKMTRTISLYSNNLYQAGFKSGERVYITSYIGFSAFMISYWNPILGRTIYPLMSPIRSNFVAITVP